jgi:hypothetical protein
MTNATQHATRKLGVLLEVGAVAMTLGLSSQNAQANPSMVLETPMPALNQTTLARIQESWLNISGPCKARAFNADPQTVLEGEMPTAIAQIFRA